ncbi:MAG: response regulator transcription factor [Acidimicrobiales bacterium]
MGTRILTVEDDERIRTAVKMALEDEGWVVEEADNGEDALETFQRHPTDVVLIDIMLPGIDGFEVCRSIRRASDVPIVMVTARADTHDVVAGLEAGADDYLTKPFAPKELSARIRALLRRARTSDPGVSHLRFGDLEVVPEEGVVLRDGQEVHLTKTEFRLLVELASSPGRVFSREVLLERVWGYGYFGDGRLVDVHIRRLRTRSSTTLPTPPRGHRPRPRLQVAALGCEDARPRLGHRPRPVPDGARASPRGASPT